MKHHALLYRAPAVSKETAVPLLPLLDASQVEFIINDTFGIDDVRSLTETAYRTPSQGNRLGVVVVLKNITIEAEQALLKLLEEPPATTSFLFCVPDSVYILPTLLSRFSVLGITEERLITDAFANFVHLSIKERIALVSDKNNDKDTLWQHEMKQGLLAYLASVKGGLKPEELSILYYISEHLLTRGASNKQLFEELAFTLPCRLSEENATL